MLFRPSGNETTVRDAQSSKAELPICLRLDGSVTLRSAPQLSKAELPMYVTPSGITAIVSLLLS